MSQIPKGGLISGVVHLPEGMDITFPSYPGTYKTMEQKGNDLILSFASKDQIEKLALTEYFDLQKKKDHAELSGLNARAEKVQAQINELESGKGLTPLGRKMLLIKEDIEKQQSQLAELCSQLAIYDDRIEVWNPGELPKPLTPADLKRKHKSIPRNKSLAGNLFLIKYIERWGMGTNRIVDEMRSNSLSDPRFQNISGGFEVALFGPGKAFEKEIEKEKSHQLDINKRQKKALEYIKKNGSISRKEHVNISNISPRQANKDLDELLNKKLISSTGKGRNLRCLVHD